MRRIAGLLALLSFSMVASAQWHSIDTSDPKGFISLSELLRAIQFYNDSGFHCDAGTEDGYAPGAEGDQSCAPNDLDYNPQNWVVSLDELLRGIQFYNTRNYYPCPSQSTEDGFCPGTPPAGAMVFVPAGSFEMGRPYTGVRMDELPVHTVYLDAYAIGKYEVTNQQMADVLNWAYDQGYLDKNTRGSSYTGGLVFGYGQSLVDTFASSTYSSIVFGGDEFTVQSRTGAGAQSFSMADHPVVEVSWYGAVAYCNWRSEMEGLQPCYNFTDWSRYAPVRNGYRLPTEAEWERAAAWDGSRHWRYGISSDTIDFTSVNYLGSNPLGLTTSPYTSPAGWFDGVNVSPNGNVQTLNSQSPAGAYDMCGNVWEWCEDWYDSVYYASSPGSNPQGAATGIYRGLRGGSYNNNDNASYTRAALRNVDTPNDRVHYYGLRIARTP